MADLATISIVGYLGADPDVRTTPEGRQLARFRVAVNRGKRNGTVWQEHTDWYAVTAFGALVERLAGHLAWGSRVYAVGRLETHTWQAGGGEPRISLEVVATEVVPLDPPKTSGQADPPADEAHALDGDPNDALPF